MIYFAINLLLLAVGFIVFRNIDIRQKILGAGSRVKTMSSKGFICLFCISAFFVSFAVFRIILKNSFASIAVSILPAFIVYGAFDIAGQARERKEAGQITYFLMTMAKWSAVRNDIVFCLGKTVEAGIEKPMATLIGRTLARIHGGMDVIKAFLLLEKESRSEDMRYLSRNIRFAAEKGGNLQKLFTGMEQQYFRIDEEIFKRKISTARDRAAVYATVVMVIATAFWFLAQNPSAGEFYLETDFGNMLMLVFSAVFGAALLFMTRR